MFKPAKNFSAYAPNPREYYIAATTAIEKGEVVKFTSGTGVVACAGTDFDDPVLGVAAEAHDGSTTGRQSGNYIKVYDHPDQVFEASSVLLTATGGSTSTFVDSTLLPQTDNLWIGGYLKIVSCAADSSLNGKVVKISDSTGSTGSLALAETLSGAIASGDTAYLCPGPLAIGEYGWDLDSDGTDVDLTTSGGEGVQLVGVDPANFKAFYKFRLHQFGNDSAAK